MKTKGRQTDDASWPVGGERRLRIGVARRGDGWLGEIFEIWAGARLSVEGTEEAGELLSQLTVARNRVTVK
jgi:hypothetical protein